MRLNKKHWLLMQVAALLLVTGAFLLVRPHLARAVGVSTSSMSGYGAPGMPFEITNCQDLQDINQNRGAFYALANDIDCSDTVNWNDGAGFSPIGQLDDGGVFSGSLDGRGHTISGLYIDQSGAGSANGRTALFSDTGQYATLLNFKVTGATIIGNAQSGSDSAATAGIVANMYGGLVDRLHFGGSISVPGCDSAQKIGGIIGSTEAISGSWGQLEHLSSEGTITVSGSNCGEFSTTAGGLIGYDDGYSLHQSYSRMNTSLTGQTTTVCYSNCRYLGGLIGVFIGANRNINQSYYAGSLTVSSTVTPYLTYAVGGLVGYTNNDAVVNNSFSAAQITVPADCDSNDCGFGDRRSGALIGDDNGAAAANNANWGGAYFDQDLAGTTHCVNGNDDANDGCIAVNTDGLDPDYFKGMSPNPPISNSFDLTTPIYELTSDYPVLVDNTAVHPDAPTNLQTTIESTSSITVSWTAPTPTPSGYQVLCRDDVTWQSCGDFTENTSVTINNLNAATQYEFKVAAYGPYSYTSEPSASVFGTTATPGFTLVTTCQQLQNIDNDLSKYYELGRDIDCSDTINWNNGAGFKPIGDFDPFITSTFNIFSGVFKGNNYAIKDVYIDQSTPDSGNISAGLFAVSGGSIIQDVTLESPIVIGNMITGSIAGFLSSSVVTNVHVTNATVSSANAAAVSMGGFTGAAAENGTGSSFASTSFEGSVTYSGTTPINYIGGYAGNLTSSGANQLLTITNSYSNATITADNGAIIAGGFVGYIDTSQPDSAVSIANSYAAGSLSIQGTYQAPQPPIPELGYWVAGGFAGVAVGPENPNATLTNVFAHVSTDVSGDQDGLGGLIGMGFPLSSLPDNNYPGNLSSNYFDADQAGTGRCVGNLDGDCTGVSGQPNYFKNNSTNPPLSQWNFTSIWNVTAQFPEFDAQVTSTVTPIPPERLNPPTTGGGTINPPVTTPDVSTTTDDGSIAAVSGSVNGKATDVVTDEAGVLGAVKKFVRSLPAGVVVAFPYALFGLLLLAVLALLIELYRELRRLHLLQVLIHKQQLLAEERDAFWHLAANYLRAPVTLIVGGAEALHDAVTTPITTDLQSIAASLQSKIAGIMAKIEGSTSLQAISQVNTGVITNIARRAVFLVTVITVAILATLGNYAATSYRNMSPGLLGYAAQLAGFILVTILFYWVLTLLTQGKSKRKAAQDLLDRQTTELANARHELIADTANQLNPDLTVLEGTIKQLSPDQAALEPAKTLSEGTSRLREIVTSFGMLIKVQEGTGAVTANPEASTVDLSAILTKARAKLTPQITAKGVRVVAPSTALAVHAEADLANQVLESIISNAVDYSPNNGTVKVEAQRLQDAIQIRVSDQGQGIDKKQLDHLFQPFVRADGKSAMDMSHGGFGINLYLDKLIMEQLGGSITASSTPGQGTAITMTWPTA